MISTLSREQASGLENDIIGHTKVNAMLFIRLIYAVM